MKFLPKFETLFTLPVRIPKQASAIGLFCLEWTNGKRKYDLKQGEVRTVPFTNFGKVQK